MIDCKIDSQPFRFISTAYLRNKKSGSPIPYEQFTTWAKSETETIKGTF